MKRYTKAERKEFHDLQEKELLVPYASGRYSRSYGDAYAVMTDFGIYSFFPETLEHGDCTTAINGRFEHLTPDQARAIDANPYSHKCCFCQYDPAHAIASLKQMLRKVNGRPVTPDELSAFLTREAAVAAEWQRKAQETLTPTTP